MLVLRVAEPYNTREVIFVGDNGDDCAIAESHGTTRAQSTRGTCGSD